jgi:predicted TIM-barrel fold metal-dependent hydrolase
MHTNGGCKCVSEAFPDETTRYLVSRMLVKAREVATYDATIRARRAQEAREREHRIRELRTMLGRKTDKDVIAERREMRAEIERLEMEGMR